tara:strand:+ start:38 stop:223 length:186 start_codon:yes stop_codon:yes gene_type:complete
MTDNEHQAAMLWLQDKAETNIHAQFIIRALTEKELFINELEGYLVGVEDLFRDREIRSMDS